MIRFISSSTTYIEFNGYNVVNQEGEIIFVDNKKGPVANSEEVKNKFRIGNISDSKIQ